MSFSEGGISSVRVAGSSSSAVCSVMPGMRVVRWREARGKFFCAVSRMSLLSGVRICTSVSGEKIRFAGRVVRTCWMVAGIKPGSVSWMAMSVRVWRAVMTARGLGLLRPV